MSIISEINNYSLKKVIDDLIEDEDEAIIGYEDAIDEAKIFYNDGSLTQEEYNKIVETFNHIIAEEKEHIEELENLL